MKNTVTVVHKKYTRHCLTNKRKKSKRFLKVETERATLSYPMKKGE